MRKIIYTNEVSELVVETSGDLVEIIQSMEGDEVGRVAIYPEELQNLIGCLKNIEDERK